MLKLAGPKPDLFRIRDFWTFAPLCFVASSISALLAITLGMGFVHGASRVVAIWTLDAPWTKPMPSVIASRAEMDEATKHSGANVQKSLILKRSGLGPASFSNPTEQIAISTVLQNDRLAAASQWSPETTSPRRLPSSPPRQMNSHWRGGALSRLATTIALTGHTAGMPVVAASIV